jgi:hypothetical protein
MRPHIALKVEHPPSAMFNHLGICDERVMVSAGNRESHHSRQYSIR